MVMEQGTWVCFAQGTRLPADQCPPDSKLHYMVDYITYNSPEEYVQLQENKRIQGIKSTETYNANPGAYPACINEPPMGPEEQCGNENCCFHNILWLQYDGCTLEQAIGLTAVYSFCDGWGYGPVVDALGGMDEFDQLNEEGPDVSKMGAWYDQHRPLIHYIMDTRENEPGGLRDYWRHSQDPKYIIPQYELIRLFLEKGPDGQWIPYQVPGKPFIIPEGLTEWIEHTDPIQDVPGFWKTHIVAKSLIEKTDTSGYGHIAG